MDFFKKQEQIEKVISKYRDIIKNDASNIAEKFGINTSEKNVNALKKIENENRLLQLGIVGRVKAGKSSLLNALLFNGRSVLPKAATPMTAALTIISYGDKLSAEVDFFSEKDIENIKKEYNEYLLEKKRLIAKYKEKKQKKQLLKKSGSNGNKQVKLSANELPEIEEKANKKANKELKANTALAASYDQYEKIRHSGVTIEEVTSSKKRILSADSLSGLSESLKDYVGADGKYMPFTKSVHIKIHDEKLKDIRIVDTPGVNDPVVSREERTRELLKYCDAILIVSPSGQFISEDDINLMDRITTKEGVRELFVVASQVDNQLFGSIKRDSGGNLYKSLDMVISQLAKHMHDSLDRLKHDCIGTVTTYDQLIDESKERIIHSSGISKTMMAFWDSRDKWDSGTTTAWNNLKENYPDYFSDQDKILSIKNLENLANIETVNEILNRIRNKKEEILRKRKENFISAKSTNFAKYQETLLNRIAEKIREISEADLEKVKKEQAELKKLKDKVATELESGYKDVVMELNLKLKDSMKGQLGSYFQDVKNEISNAEGSETESYKVENSGIVSWGARLFGLGGYETRTRHYTTVLAGQVRGALEDLTLEIEGHVSDNAEKVILDWQKETPKRLIQPLRSMVDDENLDPYRIKQVRLNIFNRISYPNISYSGTLPNSLGKSGKLTGSSAEDFLSDAREYVSDLRRRVTNDINNYVKQVADKLKAIKISSQFTEEYDNELSNLQELIENKEYSLDRLKRFKNELQTMGQLK